MAYHSDSVWREDLIRSESQWGFIWKTKGGFWINSGNLYNIHQILGHDVVNICLTVWVGKGCKSLLCNLSLL